MSIERTGVSITPFLWFDGNAEEAVDFYLTIFADSTKAVGMKNTDGSPLIISFDLLGFSFTALNGDRHYPFNNSISFVITCQSQAEIDHYWTKLTEHGGQEGRCGWLTDRFGLAWQVVPQNLGKLLESPAAMKALGGMRKLEISTLIAAG